MSRRRRGSEKVGCGGNLDPTLSRTFSFISVFLSLATQAVNNFPSVRTSYNRVTMRKIFVTFPQHAQCRTLLLAEATLPRKQCERIALNRRFVDFQSVTGS